jgi:hypothetical protein
VNRAAGGGPGVVEETCVVGIAGRTGGATCVDVSAVRKLVMELTHRELRLVSRRVSFSSESETFSEGGQEVPGTVVVRNAI